MLATKKWTAMTQLGRSTTWPILIFSCVMTGEGQQRVPNLQRTNFHSSADSHSRASLTIFDDISSVRTQADELIPTRAPINFDFSEIRTHMRTIEYTQRSDECDERFSESNFHENASARNSLLGSAFFHLRSRHMYRKWNLQMKTKISASPQIWRGASACRILRTFSSNSFVSYSLLIDFEKRRNEINKINFNFSVRRMKPCEEP